MILETIRRLYPELTRSQRKLADFVAESYREAAFMTAASMAQRLALNEATVIRFAQRLGYAGYPEMMRDVRALVQEELDAPEKAEVQEVGSSLLDQLNTQLAEAQRCVSHIPPDLAEKAVDAIVNARRIAVAGQGLANAMAQLFGLSLRACGLAVECVAADPLCLAMLGSELARDGLVVGIALGGSPQVANLLQHARNRGATTLALCCSSVSPCAQAAEIALVCGQNGETGLPALTPMAVTIDAIAQSVAKRLGTRASTHLAALRAVSETILPGSPALLLSS